MVTFIVTMSQESSSQGGQVLRIPEEQPCTQSYAKEPLLTREMAEGINGRLDSGTRAGFG